MPLYEYRCVSCSHKFEVMQAISVKPEETSCPHCQEKNVQRLMSSFASQVKGERKPGFSEMKALDMCNERVSKFAKLPPIMGARANPATPNMTQPTDSSPESS